MVFILATLMIVTNALGSASGIQNTGVQDNSIPTSIGGQASIVGVIAGYFRRGPLYAFPVSANDYRIRLGHDPDNKFYVAVQDALKLFPIVWIQRLTPTSDYGIAYSFLKIEQSDDLLLFDGNLSPILIESGV